MTEKEIFEMAIRREIEAHLTYKRLSEVVESEDVRVLFASLSNDEILHRDSLAKVYKDRFHQDPPLEIKDINIVIPERFKRSYALEVIDSAIAKENEASRLYRSMAEESQDENLKRLLLRFADMEDGHFELLQAERNRMISEYYWFSQNEDRSLED